MLRKQTPIYAIVLLLSIPQHACPSPADLERRAYTVDDLLKIEEIHTVRFGPDGQTVVFEYLPPYDERGEYGVERGGQILKLSLSAKRQAEPLFIHEAGKNYWMGDVSPDGQRMIVFVASRHQTKIAIYEFETNHLGVLDEIPQLNERFELNTPLWINEHEVVFSSLAQAWTQNKLRSRPHVAGRTSALWERAFAGEASSAALSTTPSDPWYDGSLIRYNVITKRSEKLGRGRYGSFALSPNGSKIAALRLGQRSAQNPVGSPIDYYRFDTQLYVFDLENESSQSFLPNTHVLMGSLRWSSSSSTLSFFAWSDSSAMRDGEHHLLRNGAIHVIHVEALSPSWVNIVPSGALRMPVVAEWTQEQLVIHGTLGDSTKLRSIDDGALADAIANRQGKWHAVGEDVNSAEELVLGGAHSWKVHRFQDGRLLLRTDDGFHVASDGGLPVALEFPTDGRIRILNGERGDEIGDTIVFTISDDESDKVGFLDLARLKAVGPAIEVASRVIAWDAGGRKVIARSDTDVGGKLYLQGPTTDPVAILSFNDHLSGVDHPRWDTIEYIGADGVPTYSCVLLPYNYDPEQSYPTIVDVYPGTGKSCKTGGRIQRSSLGAKGPLANRNEILSASGYLVLQPSNTYQLNHAEDSVYGGLETQVDAALNALERAGMTDPERIGLWGFSNGSMASLWLASVSSRYDAVVPMFGGSSPYIEYFSGATSSEFHLDLGRPLVHLVNYESEHGAMPLSMGGSAIDDPLRYIKGSPLDRAEHICSPTMMIHSDFDSFSSYHYEALFSAMYRLGNTAQLIRYYGEGHGVRSPENIRDFYRRILEFFETHVASGTPSNRCGSK